MSVNTPERVICDRLVAQCGARAGTFHFGKSRGVPGRQAHALTFGDQEGPTQSWACTVRQDEVGEWQFEGGAGGGLSVGACMRGYPWANLGGGGWPRDFYAGGRVEEDDGRVARARLRAANGVVLEDTVDEGVVLFVTNDEVQLPLAVELLDARGEVVSQHRWFGSRAIRSVRRGYGVPDFRYFPGYAAENIEGESEERCAFCGANRILTGAVEAPSGELTEACLTCFLAGKAVAGEPDTVGDLAKNVAAAHPDWTPDECATYIAERRTELSRTPPVPWIQENEWPVCGDDFAVYLGEWTQERLIAETGSEAAARAKVEALARQTFVNISDESLAIAWQGLVNWWAVFAFRCAGEDREILVVQTG